MTNRNNAPRIIRTTAVTGLALLALGACTSPRPDETGGDDRACVGLYFASVKGGPGAIEMRVYPDMGVPVEAEFYGRVVNGNDSGAVIAPPTDTPPEYYRPHGEFTYTWDELGTDPLQSLVKGYTVIDGKHFDCPATVVTFDPQTYDIEPWMPGVPR